MYKDRYHPAVKKDLKKLDLPVRKSIQFEWIPKLLADPHSGEELTGPLSGIRSLHVKIESTNYRIAYLLCEREEVVQVLMIGKRENFYQILRGRLG